MTRAERFRRRAEAAAFCLAFGVLLVATGHTIPASSPEAHRYADSIAAPRFEADYNEWRMLHSAKPGHEKTVDVKDSERWNKVAEEFEDLKKALKRGGY